MSPAAAASRAARRAPCSRSRMTGRVVASSSDRQGIEGATVTAQGPDGQSHVATTSADGRWSIDGLAPGSYHVTVAAAGRASQTADEALQAGAELSFTWRLAPEAAEAPADKGED